MKRIGESILTVLALTFAWFWWVALALVDVCVLIYVLSEPVSQATLFALVIAAGLTWLWIHEAEEAPWR